MSRAWQIAKKELSAFFSSPVAFLFLSAFLAVTLFIFFSVEAFFARNIADVRPLFEWIPILMIFLVGALTMRMWSEERRAGTIEFLFTLPVSTFELVLGKFLACMTLVAIALLLTIPVPISVSFIGEIDWGPVVGAFLASLFLAAAYVSVGLYISSKSDNQIVSLIGTVLACSFLYLIGSSLVTELANNRALETLKLLGSGSRFESITRGVLDLRDFYYYLSIVGIFLSLNILSLERLRWSEESPTKTHTLWRAVCYLFVANFFLGNIWLNNIAWARLDITHDSRYSISDASEAYLEQLQEPLLIRGYFSERTHPLLAPLVPQLRDLIKEYAVLGGPNVRAEFIDPRDNAELEEEANKKFGIKPVPFQIADRYQASLVNSYFDIVVQYGDKHEVLSFQDLIEVKVQGEGELDVLLRNPEYDITRAIKKVMYGFQTTDNLFASLNSPVVFQGFFSSDAVLPDALQQFRAELNSVLEELAASSNGKFEVSIEDPQAGDGALARQIQAEYGFQPMATSLFDTNSFYFYMLLRDRDQAVVIPLPEDLSPEGAQRSIEAALKRFSAGFLKTIGLSVPQQAPASPFMPQAPDSKSFQILREKLSQTYTVKDVNLASGIVPEDIDLLMLIAPEDFDEKATFAVDQFLMKGGSVVLATSPYTVSRSQTDLNLTENTSGLEEWLKSHGIEFQNELVFDRQNESYPIPVQRQIGAFSVQEIRMIPYPPFVNIRGEGMNQDVALIAGVPQVTLNWPSPLSVNLPEGSERSVIELLNSSEQSWSAETKSVIPNFTDFPVYGFPPAKEEPKLLAAVVEGEFTSFFSGKESPLLQKSEETPNEGEQAEEEPAKEIISGVIERSPESARIIVFGSNEFVADQTLQISASTGNNSFLNSVQLLENSVDWSLEDRGLLSIRSRGHFSKTLDPTTNRMLFEVLNYAFVLLGLLVIFTVYRSLRSSTAQYQATILKPVEA